MVVLFHIKIVFHRILELLRMGKHLELVSRKKANLLIDTCLNLGYQENCNEVLQKPSWSYNTRGCNDPLRITNLYYD